MLNDAQCAMYDISINMILFPTSSVFIQNLAWLDVSRNKLTTACLGSHPQLPSLETLILAGNDITELKKNDFYFLNQSSSFRMLSLSSLPLKKVRRNFAAATPLTFTDPVFGGRNEEQSSSICFKKNEMRK